MFDFNKENLKKEIRESTKKRDMTSAILDMMSEIMLASDTMPEEKKAQIRLINASRELETLIHKTAMKLVIADEQNVEFMQKICLLYATMTAQINAIINSAEKTGAENE